MQGTENPNFPSMRDYLPNVTQTRAMVTNTRNFLRAIASFKAKARKGETIRVQGREGEFLFTAATSPRSLLGSAKGKIIFHDELATPTLENDDWSPSL